MSTLERGKTINDSQRMLSERYLPELQDRTEKRGLAAAHEENRKHRMVRTLRTVLGGEQ